MEPDPTRPPEVIDVGGGVLLRRLGADDAEGVARAVAASLPELRPWMPWANEEATDPAVHRRRFEEVDPAWEAGDECNYVIVEDEVVVGCMGLHARIGPHGLEIGYWLQTDRTGRGIVTRCVEVLAAAALALPGIDQVQIRCDEANDRSAAVPARLGFRLARVEPDEVTAPGEVGRSMVWVHPPDQEAAPHSSAPSA